MSNRNPYASFSTDELLAGALTDKRRIEAAQEELRGITEELSRRVGHQTGTHVVSGVGSFVVAENNTYPQESMFAALAPGQVRRCSKTVLDNAVVKRLYPEVYTAAKVTNGTKVTLKG